MQLMHLEVYRSCGSRNQSQCVYQKIKINHVFAEILWDENNL